MQTPPSLYKWQTKFAQILFDKNLDPYPKAYQIYKMDFTAKLETFLTDYYPSLPLLISYTDWRQLIAHPFIAEMPPLNWNIVDWVKRLPDWLRSRPALPHPLLLPLAEFERLHIETFFSMPLPRATPDQLVSKRLKIQPHVRFYLSGYSLLPFREALLDRRALPSLSDTKEHFVLFSLNEEGNVTLLEITPYEKTFLDLCDGRNLDEALELASESIPLDLLAAQLSQWTSRWLHYNIVGA